MEGPKYDTISDEEWERIAPPAPKQKKSEWDDAILAVIDGDIIAIPIAEEKDVKGARIGLARRASNGFGKKLAFRYDATRKVLAIRLIGDKPEKPERTETANSEPMEKRKPGRPKGS
jgi:hypothetical protein